MFKHAIRHPTKKGKIDIRNNSGLTPLTLAAKLGRKELFLECLELSHVVKYRSFNDSSLIKDYYFFQGNLALFKH